MHKKLSFLFLGISSFFTFIFFSFLVHKDIFTRFDFDITVRLQDKISRRFDEFFSFLSLIGSFEYMLIALIAICIILLVKRRYVAIVVTFCSFGFFHLIEIYGKTFVEHLPPPEFLLRTMKLVNFPQFHIRSEFSYPSGHAARAAFITAIIGFIFLTSKKRSSTQKLLIISGLVIYDVIMFTSRIYLGEHWTSDVIGGGLLGFALSFLSAVFI